jgi:hypothetical protein
MLSLAGMEGTTQVLVTDALGRTVFAGRTTFAAGKATLHLPLLAPGEYVLRFRDAQGLPHAAHLSLQH